MVRMARCPDSPRGARCPDTGRAAVCPAGDCSIVGEWDLPVSVECGGPGVAPINTGRFLATRPYDNALYTDYMIEVGSSNPVRPTANGRVWRGSFGDVEVPTGRCATIFRRPYRYQSVGIVPANTVDPFVELVLSPSGGANPESSGGYLAILSCRLGDEVEVDAISGNQVIGMIGRQWVHGRNVFEARETRLSCAFGSPYARDVDSPDCGSESARPVDEFVCLGRIVGQAGRQLQITVSANTPNWRVQRPIGMNPPVTSTFGVQYAWQVRPTFDPADVVGFRTTRSDQVDLSHLIPWYDDGVCDLGDPDEEEECRCDRNEAAYLAIYDLFCTAQTVVRTYTVDIHADDVLIEGYRYVNAAEFAFGESWQDLFTSPTNDATSPTTIIGAVLI